MLTLSRRPCSVRAPGVSDTASRSAAVTDDVVALPVGLVGRSAQLRVEDLQAERDQVGVGHPGAVEAGSPLTGLVLAHLREARAR